METSSFDECPQFFKVFVPRFSSECLQIPPAFVRRYLKEFEKEVTLKDDNGKLWCMGLVIIDKYVYFGMNWESFVRKHSLVFGDFLIFKLHGHSLFSVKLFGRDGCNKYILNNAKANTLNNTTTVKTEVQEEEQYPPYTVKKRFKRSTNKTSGLTKLTNQHKTNKKAASTLVKKHKRNPRFKSIISDCESSKAWVSIPRSVFKGVKLCPEIVLCNENNKKWRVKCTLRKDGRAALTVGWSEFRKQNNLKPNDTCVFELLVVGNQHNKCTEIKVMKPSNTKPCAKLKI
ncbi:hypothetical protein CsatB_023302 [Cannabis sativa]|uniref:TF-B3 domain-containing protein n=2 Tax=Cannabis sativa TaxID=3483 RepID=A0A7J6I7R0_CANSA|nr:hypothetical protein G4B88_002450 [Cannabis sativa]